MQHAKAFAIIAPLMLTTVYVAWESNSISSENVATVANVAPTIELSTPAHTSASVTEVSVQNNAQTQIWNSYSSFGNEQLTFEKKKISIQDSKYFEKQFSTGEMTESEDPVYFTEKHMYHNNDRVDGRLGTQIGQIIKINDQEIQYTPYSLQMNANDLVFTKRIQTVDLTGQQVLHNIFFDQFNMIETDADQFSAKNNVGVALYNWLTTRKDISFPAGSKCFRVITEESNVPYIKSDKSLLTDTVSNLENSKNWETTKNENYGTYISYPNISGYFEFDDLNKKYFGIVEYNGIHRYADFYPSKISFDYRTGVNQAQELFESKSLNQKSYEKTVQHLKTNKCDFYNEVASKTIEQNFIKF